MDTGKEYENDVKREREKEKEQDDEGFFVTFKLCGENEGVKAVRSMHSINHFARR